MTFTLLRPLPVLWWKVSLQSIISRAKGNTLGPSETLVPRAHWNRTKIPEAVKAEGKSTSSPEEEATAVTPNSRLRQESLWSPGCPATAEVQLGGKKSSRKPVRLHRPAKTLQAKGPSRESHEAGHTLIRWNSPYFLITSVSRAPISYNPQTE